METTTLVIEELRDTETGERIRELLDREDGVARVLVRPDRAEVYIKHSSHIAPRPRLLERLREAGFKARQKVR
jgi:hypothetical protein